MRTSLAALVLASTVALTARAQLNPLPPSSMLDGIVVQCGSAESNWGASDLARYRVAADNPFAAPLPGEQDVHGVTWGLAAPDCSAVQGTGGAYRVVTLGADGLNPWAGGLGYCYEFTPLNPDAFTLATFSDDAGYLAFGNLANLGVAPGDFGIDFWFSTSSGAYTLLGPGNSVGSGRVLWTQAPLLIRTYFPEADQEMLVPTWVASVSEQAEDGTAKEFRLAFQQFAFEGGPLAVPIPEPSSYAAGALVLCAVAALLRRRRVG